MTIPLSFVCDTTTTRDNVSSVMTPLPCKQITGLNNFLKVLTERIRRRSPVDVFCFTSFCNNVRRSPGLGPVVYPFFVKMSLKYKSPLIRSRNAATPSNNTPPQPNVECSPQLPADGNSADNKFDKILVYDNNPQPSPVTHNWRGRGCSSPRYNSPRHSWGSPYQWTPPKKFNNSWNSDVNDRRLRWARCNCNNGIVHFSNSKTVPAVFRRRSRITIPDRSTADIKNKIPMWVVMFVHDLVLQYHFDVRTVG